MNEPRHDYWTEVVPSVEGLQVDSRRRVEKQW
jgi:hypothetical protein